MCKRTVEEACTEFSELPSIKELLEFRDPLSQKSGNDTDNIILRIAQFSNYTVHILIRHLESTQQ